MRPHDFTLIHLGALIIAALSTVVWLHIPSIYFRAMWGSGQTYTMIELWNSMPLLHYLFPSLYDNSLTASMPFLHVKMDMSHLFLWSMLLGYIGNLAWAFYSDEMEDGIDFSVKLFIPGFPVIKGVLIPYLIFVYGFLLSAVQFVATPLILFNIFVQGDVMQGVTLLIYMASIGCALIALKSP